MKNKRDKKAEPEKPKHLSNANVLQGLYDTIKLLENQVKELKESRAFYPDYSDPAVRGASFRGKERSGGRKRERA